MNIYECTNEDIRTYLKEFSKTTYGKIVFILSYTIFFVSVLLFFQYLLLMVRCSDMIMFYFVFPILVLFILTTFVLGSRYYYKELRLFIERKKK